MATKLFPLPQVVNYGYGVKDEDELGDDDLTNLSDTTANPAFEQTSNLVEEMEGNELTKEQDLLQPNSTEGLNSEGHNITKPENLDKKPENQQSTLTQQQEDQQKQE